MNAVVAGDSFAARPPSPSRYGTTDAMLLSVAVATAYGLKRYYSTASADDLRWALAPTTYLVEFLTGRHFAFESGAGFVSESRYLVIAPACAGVNFLVIAFLSLSFCFVAELRGAARKCAFLSASAVAAYVAMVAVNAARISFGVALASQVHVASDAARAGIHRAEGVVTYLTSLWLLVALARWSLRAASR